MQSDLKDLLKNEWSGMINNLEGEKSKLEANRKERLANSKNDSQLQA